MSGVILCVGACALDTIFRLNTLPTGPGKYLPTDAIQVAQAMATAQATSIARLGGKARLWASIGDDPTGARILDDLSTTGIDLSAMRRVAGAKSGYSTIFMDRTGERTIVPFYDPALRSAPDALPNMHDVAAVSVDVRWPDAAAMALRAARERNLPAILDLEMASRETLERLAPLASHIIASEPGALALTGEADPAIAAIALSKLHPGFVAVTAGERGVFWPGGHQPAFPIDAIDTLAAGDVFHGSFALRLTEGASEPDAIRFASAAAAIKCTRFGGRLGAPTRDEVEALLSA